MAEVAAPFLEQRPPAAGGQGPSSRAAWVILAAIALVFVLAGRHRLVMPLGDSHDGRNAGVWATGALALRREGPIDSRLGARLVDAGGDMVYADHPPATYIAEAASTAVLGDHGFAIRLPALLASLASLGLVFALLSECGAPPLAAAAGVAIGFGCPMFGGYGLMADSWILGLAPALAALLVWERAMRGREDPPVVIAAIGFAAAVTCWQALILIGLMAIVTIVRPHTREGVRRTALLLGGAALALVLTVAWQLWALGSLRTVLNQLSQRSGSGSTHVGTVAFLRRLDTFGHRSFMAWQLAALLLGGVVVCRWARAFLPVLAVSLGTVVIWTMGLRDGAFNHEYWTFWITVPIAIATAGGLTSLLRARDGTERLSPTLKAMPCCALALGVIGLLIASAPAQDFNRGAQAGRALLDASYPANQRQAWYVGQIDPPTDWITYLVHRTPVEVTTPGMLTAISVSAPSDLVLVALPDLDSEWPMRSSTGACRLGVPRGDFYAVMTVAALQRAVLEPPCAPSAGPSH